MDIDKQDLDEQIEHHQEMLRILRRRLHVQERKEAEYGINVPAEVATEIMTLNERIAKHETELTRLRSIAAEGEVPLAEVEYRAALAAAWEPGRPTVAGAAHLEWVRVRSGIKPEKAKQLEQVVKTELAEEALQGLRNNDLFNGNFIPGLIGVKTENDHCIDHYYDTPIFFMCEFHLKDLGRAIRLDISRTIKFITMKLASETFRVTKNKRDYFHCLRGLGFAKAPLEEITAAAADPVRAFALSYRNTLTDYLNVDFTTIEKTCARRLSW